MLRPIVCAVEAYDRLSFDSKVKAQPGNGLSDSHGDA